MAYGLYPSGEILPTDSSDPTELTPYLTFYEYKELGGELVPESKFNRVERRTQRLLDYITFDRIQRLPEVPAVVKDVLVELVDRMYQQMYANGDDRAVTSYSNGVESFTFSVQTQARLEKELAQYVVKWLPDYLTARSVSFDIENYLQSISNCAE